MKSTMGMIYSFLVVLTFNKLIVSEMHEKNAYHFGNAEKDQMEMLETTTNYLNFNFSDTLPSTQLPSSYDCKKDICIIKCCSEDQYITPAFQCENISSLPENIQDWQASNYEKYVTVIKSPSEIISSQKGNNFRCTFYKRHESFSLNDDGTVYLLVNKIKISQESYCIGNFLEDGLLEESAVLCFEKVNKTTENPDFIEYLHITAVSMSTVSLFIMVLIYIFTPHKLDLQKRCTLACCVVLFFQFSLRLINRTAVTRLISGNGCFIVGILMQYLLLSFFFWLNINCYEIFRIIRGTFNLQSISNLSHSNRRFIIYSLYCNGFPLLICGLTIAMQLIPRSSFPLSVRPYIIKPGINEGRCFLKDGKPQIVYYYIFEIFTHILNAFFMGYTSYLIYKDKLKEMLCRKKTSDVVIRTHVTINHFDAFKQQMRIYILYIFIYIINTITLADRREKLWIIVDLVVTLQGVFVTVFILYTSRALLVLPLVKKVSSSVRGLSSFTGEEKSVNSVATETSQISLNPLESKEEAGKNKV